jgi:ribosomal-protein-alanine N-acetyltransferase
MGALLPELHTARLTLRLARPGMHAAMARFLTENYPGHLDKWSPPAAPAFFTESFWRERLAIAVEEFQAGRAARFVLQLRGRGREAPAELRGREAPAELRGREAPAELRGREAPAEFNAPILGTCNYTNIVRGPFQACHLGYQVARDREGQGLMAEALRATNAYAFETLRLHRIMANHRPENERSARLLERLGFAREGVAKDYLFIDGAWRDHVLTSLTHPAYDPAWIEPAGR